MCLRKKEALRAAGTASEGSRSETCYVDKSNLTSYLAFCKAEGPIEGEVQ